jgi:hypothetical protein
MSVFQIGFSHIIDCMAADVNAGMNPFPVTQLLAADTLALIQNARMNGIKRYRTTLS